MYHDLIKYNKIKCIKLTATNIVNGFEEDSNRECFLANGLNIEDSRMFSVAPISRYTVLYPIGRPVRATITLYPIGRPVRATITLFL